MNAENKLCRRFWIFFEKIGTKSVIFDEKRWRSQSLSRRPPISTGSALREGRDGSRHDQKYGRWSRLAACQVADIGLFSAFRASIFTGISAFLTESEFFLMIYSKNRIVKK